MLGKIATKTARSTNKSVMEEINDTTPLELVEALIKKQQL